MSAGQALDGIAGGFRYMFAKLDAVYDVVMKKSQVQPPSRATSHEGHRQKRQKKNNNAERKSYFVRVTDEKAGKEMISERGTVDHIEFTNNSDGPFESGAQTTVKRTQFKETARPLNRVVQRSDTSSRYSKAECPHCSPRSYPPDIVNTPSCTQSASEHSGSDSRFSETESEGSMSRRASTITDYSSEGVESSVVHSYCGRSSCPDCTRRQQRDDTSPIFDGNSDTTDMIYGAVAAGQNFRETRDRLHEELKRLEKREDCARQNLRSKSEELDRYALQLSIQKKGPTKYEKERLLALIQAYDAAYQTFEPFQRERVRLTANLRWEKPIYLQVLSRMEEEYDRRMTEADIIPHPNCIPRLGSSLGSWLESDPREHRREALERELKAERLLSRKNISESNSVTSKSPLVDIQMALDQARQTYEEHRKNYNQELTRYVSSQVRIGRTNVDFYAEYGPIHIRHTLELMKELRKAEEGYQAALAEEKAQIVCALEQACAAEDNDYESSKCTAEVSQIMRKLTRDRIEKWVDEVNASVSDTTPATWEDGNDSRNGTDSERNAILEQDFLRGSESHGPLYDEPLGPQGDFKTVYHRDLDDSISVLGATDERYAIISYNARVQNGCY